MDNSHDSNKPVAWLVYENWRKHSLFFTKEGAEDFKNASQRNDDLSGNLSRWKTEPLYTSPQPAQRKPLGYAGITIWGGDATVTKMFTETEMKFAREPRSLIESVVGQLLDELAAHNIRGQS